MTQYKVAVIVGSLRKDSINRKLVDAVIKLAPKDFTFKHSEIGDLPLYNQDDDANQSAATKRLKAELADAHAILIATPEYNRSIPGVLKNAIDHASRPGGQNSWGGKPSGIMGISPGPMGTAMAQQHLRNILSTLNAPAMGQPEAHIQMKEGLFDDKGNIGEASLKFMQGWMDKYVAWVKANAKV